MKIIKRCITLLLVAVMILSSMSTIFADTSATKFVDIDKSWAKQYIINVYNKGLMNGIDQTINGVTKSYFRPLDKVTNYQALITIARMSKAKDKYDLAALEAKYKTILDKYNVPNYGRLETAYCLEKGIIKEDEIKQITATTNVTKQTLCTYLGRTFGVTYDPQKVVVNYNYINEYLDAMFILAESKPHITYLIDIGVIDKPDFDIKTLKKPNFNPTAPVTRDVFAKMLDVASDKYAALKPTTPTTPTVPAVPTTPTTPTVPTTPLADTPTTVVQPDYTGTVEQIIIEYGVIVFQVQGENGTTIKKNFNVADDIKCTIDGADSSYYWKIKVGDKASIYLNKDKKISKLVIDSKIKKVTGTVENIVITDKLELKVNIKDAGSKTYFITNDTKIIKNKTSVRYDALKTGDVVYMTVDNDTVLDINADSKVTTDNGIIESIIYTRTAAPKITLIGLDGKQKEYFIRKDLDPSFILIGNATSVVFNLRPGMHVNVELENDEIIKITATRTETNDKFAGVIKYINPTLKVITMSYFDSVQQKEVEKRVYYGESKLMTIGAMFVGIDQFKVGDKVIVIGVEDTSNIKANMIILDK